MSKSKTELGVGLIDRAFWSFTFKNRKFLLPFLILSIFALGVLLAQKIIAQELTIKKLSEFEPIYVLAANKNLHIGDIVKATDFKAMIFSKKEFAAIKYHDQNDNLDKPSLIRCKIDEQSGKILSKNDIIGRIIKSPIIANDPIREECLAPIGATPGLYNLIPENHSMIDFEVPQSGFNIYLKPGDKIDLIESSSNVSKLLAHNAEIILVDSQNLDSAPYVVENNPSKKRNITLVVPANQIADIAKAKKAQNLILTISKTAIVNLTQEHSIKKANLGKPKSDFQTLTMIRGNKKEVIAQ